jgi:hypothetical protein
MESLHLSDSWQPSKVTMGSYLAAFGVALIVAGRWGWRNDAQLIECHLREALSSPAAFRQRCDTTLECSA